MGGGGAGQHERPGGDADKLHDVAGGRQGQPDAVRDALAAGQLRRRDHARQRRKGASRARAPLETGTARGILDACTSCVTPARSCASVRAQGDRSIPCSRAAMLQALRTASGVLGAARDARAAARAAAGRRPAGGRPRHAHAATGCRQHARTASKQTNTLEGRGAQWRQGRGAAAQADRRWQGTGAAMQVDSGGEAGARPRRSTTSSAWSRSRRRMRRTRRARCATCCARRRRCSRRPPA